MLAVFRELKTSAGMAVTTLGQVGKVSGVAGGAGGATFLKSWVKSMSVFCRSGGVISMERSADPVHGQSFHFPCGERGG